MIFLKAPLCEGKGVLCRPTSDGEQPARAFGARALGRFRVRLEADRCLIGQRQLEIPTDDNYRVDESRIFPLQHVHCYPLVVGHVGEEKCLFWGRTRGCRANCR